MTAFALVHGGWHGGWCWQPLRAELAARGHSTVAPDLPITDPAAVHERERRHPRLAAYARASPGTATRIRRAGPTATRRSSTR